MDSQRWSHRSPARAIGFNAADQLETRLMVSVRVSAQTTRTLERADAEHEERQ